MKYKKTCVRLTAKGSPAWWGEGHHDCPDEVPATRPTFSHVVGILRCVWRRVGCMAFAMLEGDQFRSGHTENRRTLAIRGSLVALVTVFGKCAYSLIKTLGCNHDYRRQATESMSRDGTRPAKVITSARLRNGLDKAGTGGGGAVRCCVGLGDSFLSSA
jgi:hypothetical protein